MALSETDANEPVALGADGPGAQLLEGAAGQRRWPGDGRQCLRALPRHQGICASDHRRAGRITTIGSVSGILAGANVSANSMSKHAIEAFTDSLALEMAALGVRVSVIEPGDYNSDWPGTLSSAPACTRSWPIARNTRNPMKSRLRLRSRCSSPIRSAGTWSFRNSVRRKGRSGNRSLSWSS